VLILYTVFSILASSILHGTSSLPQVLLPQAADPVFPFIK
jgi:hypothetical protein